MENADVDSELHVVCVVALEVVVLDEELRVMLVEEEEVEPVELERDVRLAELVDVVVVVCAVLEVELDVLFPRDGGAESR